jgi:hypothetical protein
MNAPGPNPKSDTAADTNSVRAPLTFIVPQDSKPYFESSALTGGEAKVFFETEDHSVTIHDMRPLAGELSLDRQGFTLLTLPTAVTDLYDDAAVARDYEAEIIALLKDATGADRVVVFDYTRRSDSADGAANPDGLRGPAGRAHVDYTVASGPHRARDALGTDEVERILSAGGRITQINVWRPISGPVRRSPLALADAESIGAAELIATEQRFPDRVGEIYQVAHAASQRWYWAPEMTRDEVLLIKGWDSLDDGRARFTPHGAFQLPGQDPNIPARESIEVRCYLVHEA